MSRFFSLFQHAFLFTCLVKLNFLWCFSSRSLSTQCMLEIISVFTAKSLLARVHVGEFKNNSDREKFTLELKYNTPTPQEPPPCKEVTKHLISPKRHKKLIENFWFIYTSSESLSCFPENRSLSTNTTSGVILCTKKKCVFDLFILTQTDT